MKKFALFWGVVGLILIPKAGCAAPIQWVMDPAQSNIAFEAVENNASVHGNFTKFTADILFDPKQLDKSHVKITVDMSSANTTYKEAQNAIKGADWLAVGQFPTATFESTSFKPELEGLKQYSATGNVTIRDKTFPATLFFFLDSYDESHAKIHGMTTLSRNQFGVGQGDWAKTDTIRDSVKVTFTIAAHAPK